jgi:hypothetical protein
VASPQLQNGQARQRLQSGYLYHYAFAMLIGVVLLTPVSVCGRGSGMDLPT